MRRIQFDPVYLANEIEKEKIAAMQKPINVQIGESNKATQNHALTSNRSYQVMSFKSHSAYNF